jgi:hypothetical protein
MDFFLWGHLKGHVYTLPTRAVEDLVTILQAGVKTVDANTCGALPSALK